MDALTSLIHEDAQQSMPPFDLWLRGRDDIFTWWYGPGGGCRGSKVVPAPLGAANGSPAFGQYKPSEDGEGYEPWALQVIETRDGRIEELTFFLDTETVFPLFGLPLEYAGQPGLSRHTSRRPMNATSPKRGRRTAQRATCELAAARQLEPRQRIDGDRVGVDARSRRTRDAGAAPSSSGRRARRARQVVAHDRAPRWRRRFCGARALMRLVTACRRRNSSAPADR